MLSLSLHCIQLLRNIGIKGSFTFFFHAVWPVYFCYRKRPPKLNLERILQKQVPQSPVSVLPSPLISLPELQDTRFNYSNLRLRSLKLAQKTITFSHRFILAWRYYTYSICFRAQGETQICELNPRFLRSLGRSEPPQQQSPTCPG